VPFSRPARSPSRRRVRCLKRTRSFFSQHAWLNLHHILWSRGEGAPLPADLPEAERTAWAAGIEFYAPYSRRNLISDDELITIKEALRNVEGRTSLDGIPKIYSNMCGASCEERMALHWTPHLEGKQSIVESLSALVATFK
jgi:hypothetical protein